MDGEHFPEMISDYSAEDEILHILHNLIRIRLSIPS